jgi:tetratricopeptide (TPR) repeat protein
MHVMSPEEHLARALAAKTARARGMWARRGLASRERLDRTIQAMLLRQLYLSYFEQRQFQKAVEVSEQALRLAVLPDVVHQDAARAAAALGDLDVAARHLRTAARIGPANRRAFHWWTLGGLFFLAERYVEAIAALERASRWATRERPLYQGHLALARCASGARVTQLSSLISKLESVPAGQGYGRFVLGLLAYYAGRYELAKGYLQSFVSRTVEGRAPMTIALGGEISRAKRTLRAIERSES